MKKLTPKQLDLLAKCDGKHKTLTDIFSCDSCEILLRDAKSIELHKIGYCHPSQANWSYGIWNCYSENSRVQCKENFGGEYRLAERLRTLGHEVKVYDWYTLGKFGVRETEKMPDIESDEVFALLTKVV